MKPAVMVKQIAEASPRFKAHTVAPPDRRERSTMEGAG